MTYRADDPLTHSTATELAAMLAKGEVSSEELVRAHLDRAVTLDGKLGAYVEVHRGEAMATAKRADEARRRGELASPIAGLPLSIKESLDCEGHASTLGIVARKGRKAARDATVVAAARRAGAIVLGQTNVPQLLLSHESRNPLYGATVNPWSGAHAPGGSSGGEGAAIAAGLSPFGIGTDIGGSIRVPAHFSGIVGLKPTLDRWSNRGSNGAMMGQEAIRSQCGPMARTVGDLTLLLRALDVRFMADEDPLVPPLPFGDPAAIARGELRVGWYVDDGWMAPSRAIGRAVHEAAVALADAGFEVRPFAPPGMRDAALSYFALMSADGGKTAWANLEGSASEPTLRPIQRMASMPDLARRLLARGMRAAGEGRTAELLEALGEKTVTETWKLVREARAYRLRFLEAMREAKVDVLLCPAHSTPAVPHGASAEFVAGGSYCMLYNLLQFPAGVVPVARVRDSEASRSVVTDRLDKRAAFIDAESAGLPIGVQIVAPPFHDERALAVMAALEAALAGRPETPRTPIEPR